MLARRWKKGNEKGKNRIQAFGFLLHIEIFTQVHVKFQEESLKSQFQQKRSTFELVHKGYFATTSNMPPITTKDMPNI